MKKAKKKAAASARRKSAIEPGKASLPNLKLSEGTDGLREALEVLKDTSQPVEKRAEALRILQAASFGDEDFDAVRGDYMATLRALTEDNEVQLRQRSLGLLARAQDTYAEKVLMTGLKQPAKAVVPAGVRLHYLRQKIQARV